MRTPRMWKAWREIAQAQANFLLYAADSNFGRKKSAEEMCHWKRRYGKKERVSRVQLNREQMAYPAHFATNLGKY